MILIIEDDKFTKSLLMETLANSGYDIAEPAQTGKDGIHMVNEYQPNVITLDYLLPDMSGKKILSEIKKGKTQPKVILISAINDPQVVDECKSLGVFAYLIKPVNPEMLRKVVDSAYAGLENIGD